MEHLGGSANVLHWYECRDACSLRASRSFGQQPSLVSWVGTQDTGANSPREGDMNDIFQKIDMLFYRYNRTFRWKCVFHLCECRDALEKVVKFEGVQYLEGLQKHRKFFWYLSLTAPNQLNLHKQNLTNSWATIRQFQILQHVISNCSRI